MAEFTITDYDTEQLKVTDVDLVTDYFIKKAYLTMVADGDNVNMFWHRHETDRDRKFLSINYADISSFTAADADDAVVRIKAVARTYKVYTALFNQSTTEAPVPTILGLNTIGTIVWTYVSVGEYEGALSTVFTENKTWFSGYTWYDANDAREYHLSFKWIDSSTIKAFVFYIASELVDTVLINTPLEIRVYSS